MAFRLYGAPGRIRTSDLMVRSHALYPTELRALSSAAAIVYLCSARLARPEGLLRTSMCSAPLGPLLARYRGDRSMFKIVPDDFVEPPTSWFVAMRSVQPRYGRKNSFVQFSRPDCSLGQTGGERGIRTLDGL